MSRHTLNEANTNTLSHFRTEADKLKAIAVEKLPPGRFCNEAVDALTSFVLRCDKALAVGEMEAEAVAAAKA